MKTLLRLCALAAFAWAGLSASARAADAKVVLVAGHPSHGPGEHEFNAGIKLLARCLGEVQGIEPVVVTGGWPKDEKVFDGARTLVFFMDGGGGHPMIQGDHLKTLQKLMDQGVGLVCLHYAVEVPKGNPGDRFLDWIGGYYESGYSTNPHWAAAIKSFPDHPITKGVKPFTIRDEWYFNLRFRPERKGITPIIVARPEDQVRGGNQYVREAKGREEVLAWAVERPDGGRGFGFTGAHTHKNWGNADFRKLVLNAILWSAKLDVPSSGVQCAVSPEDLEKDLDPKGQKK